MIGACGSAGTDACFAPNAVARDAYAAAFSFSITLVSRASTTAWSGQSSSGMAASGSRAGTPDASDFWCGVFGSWVRGLAPGWQGLGERSGSAQALPAYDPAAVHVDHLAGDVPGPVRSQEQGGLGDLFWLAETLQRVHGDCLIDVLGRDSPLGFPVA